MIRSDLIPHNVKVASRAAATTGRLWYDFLNAALVAGAILLISLLVTACSRSPSPEADAPELRMPAGGSAIIGQRPTATPSAESTPINLVAATPSAAPTEGRAEPDPSVSDGYARIVAALVVLLVVATLARRFLELLAAALKWVAAMTGTVLLLVLVGYVLAT